MWKTFYRDFFIKISTQLLYNLLTLKEVDVYGDDYYRAHKIVGKSIKENSTKDE